MLQFLEVAGCLSCQFHEGATEGGGAVEAAFVGDVLQSEFWVLLHERQARMPDGLGCMCGDGRLWQSPLFVWGISKASKTTCPTSVGRRGACR